MNPITLSGAGEVEPNRTTTRAEAERLTDVNASPQKTNAVAPKVSDSITVSDRAAAIGELTAKAEQLPDVREGRIEKLRSLIEARDYHPAAADIADAILKDENGQQRPLKPEASA